VADGMTEQGWKWIPEEIVGWCWGDTGAELDCPCGATIAVDTESGIQKCACGCEYRCYRMLQMREVEEGEWLDVS